MGFAGTGFDGRPGGRSRVDLAVTHATDSFPPVSDVARNRCTLWDGTYIPAGADRAAGVHRVGLPRRGTPVETAQHLYLTRVRERFVGRDARKLNCDRRGLFAFGLCGRREGRDEPAEETTHRVADRDHVRHPRGGQTRVGHRQHDDRSEDEVEHRADLAEPADHVIEAGHLGDCPHDRRDAEGDREGHQRGAGDVRQSCAAQAAAEQIVADDGADQVAQPIGQGEPPHDVRRVVEQDGAHVRRRHLDHGDAERDEGRGPGVLTGVEDA